MRTRETMVTTALLLGASALSAQMPMRGRDMDRPPGMMGERMMMQGMMGQGMMGPDMMRMMGEGMAMMPTGGPGPAMVLRMAEELEVTDAQESRLEEIRDELSQDHEERMASIVAARKRAADALEGNAQDLDAYREALEEAAAGMMEVHVAMARAAAATRAVLTQKQRTRLQESLRMMRGMMGAPGMGRGGMRGRTPPR